MPNDLSKLVFTIQEKDFLLRRIEIFRQFSNYEILPFLEDKIIENFRNELGFLPIVAYPTHFEGTFNRIVITYSPYAKKRFKLTL